MIKVRKENIVIIVLIIAMILAVIGVSYAAYNYSKIGTKVNSITTGSITMSYEESDNVINIDKALPTTDKTGKVRLKEGEYFDFTVSSEIVGDININYEISAKDVTTSERKIDGSNIKLYLTRLTEDGTEEELMAPEVYNEEKSANSYTGRPSGEMSLYTSSMSSSESNKYRLRMYVTEEYNPQNDGGNLEFSVKINVYGKDGNPEDILPTVSEVLLANIPKENQYDDGTDTFITGENPNNYIWYSGKLWRAVLVNNEAKTTKLVTQWNISAITYNPSNQTNFEGSYMEDWLNDTTVDGFLGNLRDYEKFIVTDAKWNATLTTSSSKPAETTMVTDAVGLLNFYEYVTSYRGTSFRNGYLNNGLNWWTLTPSSSSHVRYVSYSGGESRNSSSSTYGVRPSINLKSDVKIANGDGTIDNPYRLNGDNDTDLIGTLLNERYSGEYILFGNDDNNLYRIVSHENGTGTKITSAEPLKRWGRFITSAFGSGRNPTFSSTSTIGSFLNRDYLTQHVESSYSNMIEDNTAWYLGTVESGTSYKLAKYKDISMSEYATSTDAKVGLLRFGELMTGQFDGDRNNMDYWTLTTHSSSSFSSNVRHVTSTGYASYQSSSSRAGVKPSLNIKSNVVITGGDGTKENPFTIELQ